MKQFFQYLRRRDLRGLFSAPTDDTFIQFFRYVFVGGAAFVVDAAVLWLCSLKMNYLLATAIAFAAGLIANYLLSKWLVFTRRKGRAAMEFLAYGVIGVIGLGITEGLMYLLTGVIGLHLLISKIIAAAIVLVWNFAARKILLYRE